MAISNLIPYANMRWRFEPSAYRDMSGALKYFEHMQKENYENHLIFMFCWKRFRSLLWMVHCALIKGEIRPNTYKFQSNVVENDERTELVMDKETTGLFCCFLLN